ncbi:hypothetical protein Esti_000143 [Eimeria stiedai]
MAFADSGTKYEKDWWTTCPRTSGTPTTKCKSHFDLEMSPGVDCNGNSLLSWAFLASSFAAVVITLPFLYNRRFFIEKQATAAGLRTMAVLLRNVHFKTDEGEPTIFNLPEQPTGSHQLPVQARPRRQTAVGRGTVAALVVVMVFLTALTTCFHFSRKTVRRHEHVGRRLAAGQDDEGGEDRDKLLSDILEQCLDMEAEFGSLPGQEEGEEEDKLLSRILDDCLEMQEEFNMPLSESPLTEGQQAVFEAFSSIYRLQKTVDQVHSALTSSPEGAGAVLPHQQRSILSQSPLEPSESRISEVLSALLSASASEPAGWRPSTEASPQVSITSQLEQPGPSQAKLKRKWGLSPPAFGEAAEPKKQRKTSMHRQVDAAAATIELKAYGDRAAKDIPEQQGGQPQPPPADSTSPSATAQGAESRSAGSPVASSCHEQIVVVSPAPVQPAPTVPAALTGVDPSSVDQAAPPQATTLFPLPPPASPMSPETHLYYRLPIFEPGSTRKTFSVVRAFATVGSSSAHPHLHFMRNLLTRPTITRAQAEVLILCSEELVGHLWRFHRTPVDGRKPSHTAYLLARRFLCLEALFTVIQILGPAMHAESWWPKLMEAIPTDVDFATPVLKPKIVESVSLAERLSSALASMKRGIRLSLEETVKLKRWLFKEATIKLGFQGPKWDPWRKDDPDDAAGKST